MKGSVPGRGSCDILTSMPMVVLRPRQNRHPSSYVDVEYTVDENNVIISKRRLISSLVAFSSLVVVPLPVRKSLAAMAPPDKDEIWVHPGDTLSDAISQAPPGSVIHLGEGEYIIDTTLEIQKPLCIRGQASIISLSTKEPYRPVFQVSSTSGVTLENMKIRHQSPSVANNYAVYIQNAGDCTIQNMDISSSTGTGVTVEGILQGTTIRIQHCTIHDCAKNGVGIFPSIEDTGSAAAAGTEIVVQGMSIERNQGHGMVVKGMQDTRVTIMDDNEIHLNRLYGLQVSDSENVHCISSSSSSSRGEQASDDVFSRNGSGAIQFLDDYSRIR